MNDRYTIPGVILGLVAFAAIGLMNNIGKQVDAAKADRETITAATEADRMVTEIARSQLAQARKNSVRTGEFLKNWSVPANDASTLGTVVERLARLSQDHQLIGNRRPTPIVENYPFGGVTATVQQVGFLVTGPYAGVLGWLGDVEASFPFARPERVEFKARNSEVELEITLSFLVVDSNKP
jgi:hypothetical protein